MVADCANNDNGLCPPLDTECFMLGKWYTGCLCRYFKDALLPENPVLESALKGEPAQNTKPCTVCKKPFTVSGRKSYCSDKCQEIGRRKLDAERSKKYRDRQSDTVTN